MADRGPPRSRSRSSIPRARRFTIIDLIAIDYQRTIELIGIYADLGLGFVDASIIAIAERRSVTQVATLNRRDFAVVRPAHCDALELVP